MHQAPGYLGYGPLWGSFIPEEEALEHALRNCGLQVTDPAAPGHADFIGAFTDWFYSRSYCRLDDEQG